MLNAPKRLVCSVLDTDVPRFLAVGPFVRAPMREFDVAALVEMQEREKILSGEEKDEPSRIVKSRCLLTEPTPS